MPKANNNNYNNKARHSCEITNLCVTQEQQQQQALSDTQKSESSTVGRPLQFDNHQRQDTLLPSEIIQLVPNTPFLEINIRPINGTNNEEQLDQDVNEPLIDNLQCFLFNNSGVLVDAAHENNPRIHNGAISLKCSPSLLTMNLDLQYVNSSVRTIGIAFQISVKECDQSGTPPVSMGASVHFVDDKNRTQYSIPNCSLILNHNCTITSDTFIPVLSAILYRSSDNLNQWKIIAIQKCCDVSSPTSTIVKQFQQLIEEYGLLKIKPQMIEKTNNNETFADDSAGIELEKGEDFEIHPSVHKLIISGGWRSTVNVDMALGVYDRELAEIETGSPVFYGNRDVFDGAIRFREITAGISNPAPGHKSFLHICLSDVPSNVSYMIICMTVADRDKSFIDIEDPYLIVSSTDDSTIREDEDNNTTRDLCKFMLKRAYRHYETSGVTAYLMASLHRTGSSWTFKAMGTWADGRRVPDTFKSLCTLSRVVNLQENALLAIDICVPEARELKAFDLNGYSDPYFKIFINGTHVFTSDTVMKSLNPRWEKCNYKVTVPVKSEVTSTGELIDSFTGRYDVKVEVWDYDTITADDFMGWVGFTILLSKTCTKFEQIHRWYELMPAKGMNSSNWRLSKSIRGFLQIDTRFELKAKDSLVEKWILKVID